MADEIIPVQEGLTSGAITFKSPTIYKWHSQCRYPRLIFRDRGRLFWNVSEDQRMKTAAMEKNQKRATRMKRREEAS